MKNACELLLGFFQKELSYLHREDGFQIIEERSDRSDYCLVFLESNKFRIKGYMGPDYVDLLFGTLEAPLIWEDKSDGVTHWYSLGILDGYFRGVKSVQMLTEEEWREKTVEIQIQHFTELMNQHMPAIKNMFGKENSIQGKKNLDEYIKLRQKEARVQYENLARNKLDT